MAALADQPPFIRDAGDTVALLPQTASAVAGRIDLVFYLLLAVCVFIVVLIGGLILYYSVRYRAGSTAPRKPQLPEPKVLRIEAAWSGATLIVFLVAFYWGASLYIDVYGSPPADLEISVIGKQWMWKVQHENGVREINELHVPVGKTVRLRLTSQDVIHSFYLPAFRMKRDAVPQRYTGFWLRADKPGTYSLLCTEFCGTDHSLMRGRVVAMTPHDFERWLGRQQVPAAPAEQGRNLFEAYGCSGCHAAGSDVHAPHLAGIYGRPVQLADGGTVTADDDYIRDSILLPQKHVAAGYQPIMPSYEGQVGEADILELLAYIKSLDATLPREGGATP